MRTLWKGLAWLFKALVALLLVLVVASAIVIALEIRVELDPLRKPVELAAGQALERDVRFGGSIALVPTLWPTLEIRDVAIANPPGWSDSEFASAALLRLQLGLVPLLRGEIKVGEITAEKVQLNLESDRNGEPNWRFGAGAPEAEPAPQTEQVTEASGIRFTALNTLSLKEIDLSYRDRQLGQAYRFRLEEMQGSMAEGQPIALETLGRVQDEPFELVLEGESLATLRDRSADWPLRLRGELAGTAVAAEGRLIRGEEQPEVRAKLEVGRLNLGTFLARLGVVEGLEATIAGVSSDVVLRGDSLAELIAKSELRFRLEDGVWTLTDRNSGARLPIRIAKGEAELAPGRPLEIDLEASIDQEPVRIRITGAEFAELFRPDAQLPLLLAVNAGGADLRLETTVTRPIATAGLAFDLSLSGERLDTLDALVNTDLPPWGPYALNGRFGFSPKGYGIKRLELSLGETRLAGDLRLETDRQPPYLDIALASERFQINDFELGDWSPSGGNEETPEAAPPAEDVAASEASAEPGEVRALLAPETLASLDARLAVNVKQVLSGQDQLGRGSLLVTLEAARFSLDPLEVELPGGGAEARFVYHPSGSTLDLELAAKVEEFDYGVLARRIDPESQVGGHLGLDLDLKAHGDSVDALLSNGQGHLDFGLWPEQMNADVFEMWAVNLIGALMKEVDKDQGSKVNCVIARFRLADGVMNDRVIFADTTKMRIEASAQVDFAQRRIEVRAAPKAKKPELFSLATPVGLSGGFEDFDIRINPLALGGSTVSFVTSPLHVPVRRLFKFKDTEPEDGAEACAEAWRTDFGEEEDQGPSRGEPDSAAAQGHPPN